MLEGIGQGAMGTRSKYAALSYLEGGQSGVVLRTVPVTYRYFKPLFFFLAAFKASETLGLSSRRSDIQTLEFPLVILQKIPENEHV